MDAARKQPKPHGWSEGLELLAQTRETRSMGYEISQVSRWIAMAETTVKKSIRQTTLEKAEQGLCLCCGE